MAEPTSPRTDPRIAHRICPLCEACCGLALSEPRSEDALLVASVGSLLWISGLAPQAAPNARHRDKSRCMDARMIHS